MTDHRPDRRRLSLILAALLIMSAVVAIPVLRDRGQDRRPPTAGGTVPWQGEDWFLLGVNYPWLNYGNDFGANDRGVEGVSTTDAYDREFADLDEKGVGLLRWHLFADARSGITLDADRRPTGVDEQVFRDLDRALALAERHDIFLAVVLFDTPLLAESVVEGDNTIRGHSDWIADEDKRAALVETVIEPVLERYGRNERIVLWEVMNEPEWAISDLPQADVNEGNVPVTQAQFWAFAARIVQEVHARTDGWATIGSASLKWHRVWTNAYADQAGLPRLNLDVYQTHYYPWMDDYEHRVDPLLGTTHFSPLRQRYADLGLDRPMIVGEFPLDDMSTIEAIAANGYAGALAWSYWGGDGYAPAWPVLAEWRSSQEGRLPLLGVSSAAGDLPST